jgi:hypothetical protein
VQIHRLHEEWGVEQLFYCRDTSGTRLWKPEEDEIIRAHYPTLGRLELLKLLPERSWEAIRHRGSVLHIVRVGAWEKIGNQKMCYEDIVFMQQEGIEDGLKVTKWVSLSRQEAGAVGN